MKCCKRDAGWTHQRAARWVLTFDASCGTCREIARAVAQACDGKLDVMPLAHPDVRRWRQQSLGPTAPWAPTLMRIQDSDVRAWIGAAMSIRLLRLLGARSTVRVVTALGQLSHRGNERRPASSPGQDAMGRAEFLRFGAGAVVAVGFIFAGRMPALADDPPKSQCPVEFGREVCGKCEAYNQVYGFKKCRCIRQATLGIRPITPEGVPLPPEPYPFLVPADEYKKACWVGFS